MSAALVNLLCSILLQCFFYKPNCVNALAYLLLTFSPFMLISGCPRGSFNRSKPQSPCVRKVTFTLTMGTHSHVLPRRGSPGTHQSKGYGLLGSFLSFYFLSFRFRSTGMIKKKFFFLTAASHSLCVLGRKMEGFYSKEISLLSAQAYTRIFLTMTQDQKRTERRVGRYENSAQWKAEVLWRMWILPHARLVSSFILLPFHLSIPSILHLSIYLSIPPSAPYFVEILAPEIINSNAFRIWTRFKNYEKWELRVNWEHRSHLKAVTTPQP